MGKLSFILKYIFSITLTEDYLRYQLILLGIKLKFPRPVVLLRKLSNPFYKYQKEGLDITELPKATGQMRDIQLANLAILKEIDKVCKSLNIGYWLDYGSLLGAVRHKGFIPWDDDIDISMIRTDFDRFIACFEQYVQNKDLYLKHHYNKKGSYLLKVGHKNCKHLFVDVFVYDTCINNLSDEEKIRYTENLQEKRTTFLSNLEFIDGIDLYNKYQTLRNQIKDTKENEPFDLMYGIEFGHQTYIRNNWVMPYDDILPLQEIEFENYKFYTVNKPHEHLKEVFNNYMGYPKKLDLGHGAYVKLSKNEQQVIENLIKKVEVKNEKL